MTRSIFAERRYPASPSPPPKPPMRSSPAGRRGATVRPASEVMTVRLSRAAKASASCRASPVPPRIRSLLESGTAHHLSPAVDDDDLDRDLAIDHGQGLVARLPRDEIAQRQPRRLCHSQNLTRCIGASRRRGQLRRAPEAQKCCGELLAIHFAA